MNLIKIAFIAGNASRLTQANNSHDDTTHDMNNLNNLNEVDEVDEDGYVIVNKPDELIKEERMSLVETVKAVLGLNKSCKPATYNMNYRKHKNQNP